MTVAPSSWSVVVRTQASTLLAVDYFQVDCVMTLMVSRCCHVHRRVRWLLVDARTTASARPASDSGADRSAGGGAAVPSVAGLLSPPLLVALQRAPAGLHGQGWRWVTSR